MLVCSGRTPMTLPSAHQLSAAEAAAAIRTGRLRSADLVDACLQRIGEREPQVGAWQCLDAAGARGTAARRDAEPSRGPLHGVPVGIKDIIDTAGLPTERGSPIHAGRLPAADADCVARLRDAGAIVLGKTVTTELAYFQPGKTANPHRLTHTPGGSSSGSAAAVADAMVPVALGTQTAGSINRPASYCGVVGYKPTHGDFSLEGVMPFAPSLDTLGVLARRVADVTLVRAALLPRAANEPSPRARKARLAFCRTPWWDQADAAVREGIERTVDRLRAMGMDVGDVTLPRGFAALADAQKSVMAYEAVRSLQAEHAQQRGLLSDALRSLLATGLQIGDGQHARDLALARAQGDALAQVFDACDLLITPATHGEAPAGLGATGDPLFSRAWTLLGVPTLTLPAFRGPGGLPVGIQLVGARGQDEALLQGGAAVEAALGWPGHATGPDASTWRAP